MLGRFSRSNEVFELNDRRPHLLLFYFVPLVVVDCFARSKGSRLTCHASYPMHEAMRIDLIGTVPNCCMNDKNRHGDD